MMNEFPRNLTFNEKLLLFSILPESKKGYFQYRGRIDQMQLIGQGRFGGGNFILGFEGDEVETDLPSSSVFASGTVTAGSNNFDVVIHEEEENQIEFDISPFEKVNVDEPVKINSVTSLSVWRSGNLSPLTGKPVHEYTILKNKYLLVIDNSSKKIWLNESESGINYIIPVTNFFNELMRFKNIRNPKTALNPGNFFNDLEKYSEVELVSAFLMYDKYMNRFNLQQKIFHNN